MSSSPPPVDFKEKITLNTVSKVVSAVFKPDSTDCCFEFYDEAPNDTKLIKAHQKLLSALSPVFSTMFNGKWGGDVNGIRIVDVSFEFFEIFMKYFYEGEIELDTRNIDKIFYLAHKYDVSELMSACSSYMSKRLCVYSVLKFNGMAIYFDQPELQLECANFISNNTEAVLKSPAFLRCDQKMLAHILKIESMSCKEHIVFDACIEWVKAECKRKRIDSSRPTILRTELGKCFELIRFKEMDRKEFSTRFVLFKEMFKKVESDEIFVHLIQKNGMAKARRYEPMDNEDIAFKFNAILNAKTSENSTEINFKLTKSVLLEAIAFSQPVLSGTCEYVPLDARIGVWRMGNLVHDQWVKTMSTPYGRYELTKLMFIEKKREYKIRIYIPRVDDHERYEFRQRLHTINRSKSKSIDFIPLDEDKQPIDELESVIWAFFFQSCNKENLEKLIDNGPSVEQ